MSIQYVSKFQTFSLKLQKQFILYCLKKVNSVPQRMSSTFATRRATGSPKNRRSKISKRNIGTHTKKNFTAWKENYFKLAWRLTINISYYSFCHWKLTLYGSVCSNTSLFINQKIRLGRTTKLEQKQEKEEIVLKDFDSIYTAVNARLKTSNTKHPIDLVLNSPRIRLSQSDNIMLDNRDTRI